MEQTLSAFLKENKIKREAYEYVASKDFVDGEGNPIPWKIRPLTNEELDNLRDRFTKRVKNKMTQKTEEVFDKEGFTMEMATTAIEFPKLDDAQLQESYGVVGADSLLNAMLTPGELQDLFLAVNEASDFEVGMGQKIKQAKN